MNNFKMDVVKMGKQAAQAKGVFLYRYWKDLHGSSSSLLKVPKTPLYIIFNLMVVPRVQRNGMKKFG